LTSAGMVTGIGTATVIGRMTTGCIVTRTIRIRVTTTTTVKTTIDVVVATQRVVRSDEAGLPEKGDRPRCFSLRQTALQLSPVGANC
jgi:hypothetical protein